MKRRGGGGGRVGEREGERETHRERQVGARENESEQLKGKVAKPLVGCVENTDRLSHPPISFLLLFSFHSDVLLKGKYSTPPIFASQLASIIGLFHP